MDTRETLRSIAATLPGMPPETVESMLLTFDTLVHFGDQEHHPEAAGYLRDAAAQCTDVAQKDRLLSAADSLITGAPLALTPDGQTWQQAAAAQTVSAENWVEPPEPVYAESEEEDEDEDNPDELEELEELARLEDEFEKEKKD
jgi:hypothetical protein